MEKERKIPTEDGYVYHLQNETGSAEVRLHEVFPGVDLAYNEIHMERRTVEVSTEHAIIEIQHCLEGRMEQHFHDEYFYLKPGDLLLIIRQNAEVEVDFPIRHYHGITIYIQTDLLPSGFKGFLQDVDIEPMYVAQKLCRERSVFVIRNKPSIERIFSELYAVPIQNREGFFKLKIMELMLLLNEIDPEENKMAGTALSQSQVQLAKQISDYLETRTDKKFTVADLAVKYGVSKSHLQNAFKGVYGATVFEYMRIQKMQQAALALIQTDKSILEIANESGYDNGSKFAAAFQKVMGESPAEYRKAHSVI